MATTFQQVANNAIGTLDTTISASDTSVVLGSGEGALFPSSGSFHISIGTEILICTSRSSDTLTVSRAAESTTAAIHTAGAIVALNIISKHISDLNTAVNAVETILATSGGLRGNLSDETGSGGAVFATDPVLVAPRLGTPHSGVMTNVTGTASGLTAGTATVATTVTITDNESTTEANPIIFAAGAAGAGNIALESDGTLTYNPGTGAITAAGFVGALTGNVTGNASGTAATVTAGTQASITTLTNVVTVGELVNGSIASGFGTINNGANTITTTGLVTAGALTVNGTTTLNGALVLGDAAGDTLDITASATVSTDFKFADNVDIALGTNADILIRHSDAVSANAEITDIIIGTSVHPGVAANSLLVSNITQNGDMMFATNRGGNTEAHMLFDADAGDTFLYARGVQAVKITGGGAIVVTPSITANGGVVGDLTGDVTGNADTVTTNANLTGDVTSNGNATTIAGLAYSKLAALASGNILVGNGSNVAVSVNPSGDVDVTNAGVFSISSGSIIDDDVKSDAAIAISKLATITLATNTTGDYVQNITGGVGIDSNGATSGENIAHSLTLDLSELADTAIANGDYIVFTDTTDSNASVKGDLADVATLFAGTSLTASSSVISVDDDFLKNDANDTTLGTITAAGFTASDDTDVILGEAGKVNFADVAPDDGEATGVVLSFIADVTLAVGDLVYIVADGSDGKVGKADSSAAGTMPAIGVAVTGVSADAAVEVLVQGLLRRNSAYGFTIGQDLFVSETAAAVTATAPTTSGATVQKVGVALHADIAYYNFNTTEVLLA